MTEKIRNYFKEHSLSDIKLFRNLSLKIVSLLFAAMIWLLVTNYNDPVTYKPFPNIPVQLLNTDMITDLGQVYKVLDGTDVISTVTVGAPRSISDYLSRDNIIATADVVNLTQAGTIPISLTTNIYGTKIDSIQGSIESIKLDIENRKTSSFTLQTTTAGTPAEGYVLSDIITEQNQVRVSGAESVVSSIARAVATVDVSGARNTITTYANIRLYDQNDNPIDTEDLSMNITSVRTTVNVLATKMLPIRFSAGGTPATGYLRNGVMLADPAEVLVKGRISALNTTDAIVVPGEVIDISGKNSDVVTQIDISPYLPDNLAFAEEGFNGIVTTTVGIEAAVTKTLELDAEGLMLESIPDGYTVSVISASGEGVPEKIRVQVYGLAGAVQNLTADSLQGRVNVADSMGAASMPEQGGLITATVRISLPPNVHLQSASSVVLNIVPEETEETGN